MVNIDLVARGKLSGIYIGIAECFIYAFIAFKSQLYGEVIKLANVKRLANTNSKSVLLTEHVIDDNNAYITLINYANYTEAVTLSLASGYKAYYLNGNEVENLTLTFKPNECLILKISK